MRTQAERVASLHVRMEARKRTKERRKTGALGAVTAMLAACLCLVIYGGSAAHPGGTAGPFSGSTMLFENAGAYVTVAIIAFMTGTVITIVCLHQQRFKRRSQTEQPKEEEENEETEETK